MQYHGADSAATERRRPVAGLRSHLRRLRPTADLPRSAFSAGVFAASTSGRPRAAPLFLARLRHICRRRATTVNRLRGKTAAARHRSLSHDNAVP